MNTKIIEVQGRRRRRRHSAQFKSSAIQACQRPGVSIAAVALANGLNANMLRKWVIEAERGQPRREVVSNSVDRRDEAARQSEPSSGFIALPLAVSPSAADIHIELQRCGTTIKVRWPADAAEHCGVWLRELLR